jgi:hypothetical protein
MAWSICVTGERSSSREREPHEHRWRLRGGAPGARCIPTADHSIEVIGVARVFFVLLSVMSGEADGDLLGVNRNGRRSASPPVAPCGLEEWLGAWEIERAVWVRVK